MSNTNVTLARQLIEELWNKQDPTVADRLIAANCRHVDPSSPDLGTGPNVYKQMLQIYGTAFPDLNFVVDEVVDGGNAVVLRWTVTGTHKGELQGIAPTGRPIRITGVSICHFSNGKITEEFVNWDAMGMFQQLGVMPQSETLKRAA